MVLQILAALSCLLAVLLQLAVHRSPDCHDNSVTRVARRITMISMLVGAVIILDSLFFGARQYPVLALVAGLFSLGQSLYAIGDLLPNIVQLIQNKETRDGHHA